MYGQTWLFPMDEQAKFSGAWLFLVDVRVISETARQLITANATSCASRGNR
jgi:hypothetical protein